MSAPEEEKTARIDALDNGEARDWPNIARDLQRELNNANESLRLHSASRERMEKALQRADKALSAACILLETNEDSPDADVSRAANKVNAEIRSTLALVRPALSAASQEGEKSI